MNRILEQIDVVRNNLRTISTMNVTEQSDLMDELSKLNQIAEQVKAETAEMIAKWQHQFEEQAKDLEEVRRTRDSYREHYEERINVLNTQVERWKQDCRELEKRYFHTKELVVAQARFIINQEDKLDY